MQSVKEKNLLGDLHRAAPHLRLRIAADAIALPGPAQLRFDEGISGAFTDERNAPPTVDLPGLPRGGNARGQPPGFSISTGPHLFRIACYVC